MADESIIIPVELDLDKGLAQIAKFGKQLTIPVDADTKPAVKEVSDLVKNIRRQLSTLGPNASVLIPVKVDVKNLSFGQVPAQLDKLKKSSNEATFAMTNLGRVVQDAPYGFIGIANNLNPLLESFQRLKASTGTTGGALKALGGSLMGAGGLGLALSVVTTALSFASLGFSAWTRGMNSAKKETEGLEEIYKSLASNIAGQAVKLTSLLGIIQNVNAKYSDKQKALAAINQEYDSYLKSLGIEEVNLNNVASAYDRIIDAMLRQAVVKGLQDEIAKKVEETAKQIIKIETAEQKRVAAVEKATNASQQQLTVAQRAAIEQQGYNKTVNDGYIAQQRAAQATTTSMGALNNYDAVLKRTKDRLKEELAPLLKLTDSFDDLNIKLDKVKDKDPFNKIISKAKEVAEYLKKNTLYDVKYEFSPLDDKATALKKAQAFLDDVSAGRLKLRKMVIEPDFTGPAGGNAFEQVLSTVEDGLKRGIIQPIGLNIPVIITPEFAANASQIQALSKTFQSIGLKMPAINMEDPAGFNLNVMLARLKSFFGVSKTVTQEGLKEMASDFKRGIDNINSVIQSLSVEGISGFAESLGAALSGNGIGNIFQGFVNVLAQGLTAIGKQMIAMSPVIAALKAALKSLNPAILLPAGIALVAIGGALRSTVGKGVTGFAAGGLVTGPVNAFVGEGRGTNSSNPEVISPLDKLKGFFAGMLNDFVKRAGNVGANISAGGNNFSIPSVVTLRADGRDLVGLISLVNASQRRGG